MANLKRPYRDPDVCICGQHFLWERPGYRGFVCTDPKAAATVASWKGRKRRYGPFPLVMVTLDTDGSTRIMREKDAKELVRVSRMHEQSTGSQFTSETAAKARQAQLARRDRRGHQIGRKTGNKRPISRWAVRRAAAEEPQRGSNGSLYEYFPPIEDETVYPPGYWTVTDRRGTRLVSEKAALMGLGKLPRSRKVDGVPVAMRTIKGRQP